MTPILSRIRASRNPGPVHLTETQRGWFDGGYEIAATGVPGAPARCKVVLWSRWPLRQVDTTGPSSVAELRRWAAATVDTPAGELRVIGVVIPYGHSNVTHGTGRARPWDDHARYLDALHSALETGGDAIPTVVLGDYNQRMDGGRSSAPQRLNDRLRQILESFELVTGDVAPEDGYLLDHIAVAGLHAHAPALIPRAHAGVRRSDHHGVVVDVSHRLE